MVARMGENQPEALDMAFEQQTKTDLSNMGIGRRLAMLTLLAAWGITHDLNAAALSWNAAGGGVASTNTNWSPVAVPAAGDDLTFNLNAIYTVNFPAAVPTSRTHTYRLGTVTQSNSATHTITNGLTVGNLAGDNAILTLTTGVVNVSASTFVGSVAGSVGRINVNDNDADLNINGVGADLTIGHNGNGTLSITGTGLVTVADQFIAGSNSTSTSSVTVSGFSIAPIGQSVLDVLGTSQSRIGAGGDATMTVSNGAMARFAGDLVIANGSASTSSVTVETLGLVNALLNVNGDLLIGRNSSVAIAAGTGTLNLNTGGAATIGGNTFLGDPDGGTGTIALNGGTFTGTGPITVLTGSTINGTGTINAPISNSGNFNPTGAAGLTLGGILSNTTNLVTGTKIHFSNTGGYTGSGVCDAAITGDTNALITATGTLSIGNNTVSGYSYNGQLDVGGSIVTLVDSNGAVLGGKTTINSGRLECPAGIGIQNLAEIEGNGLFVGNVVNAGVLDPHTANASLGGLFTVQGDLTFNPTGKIEMDLKGPPGAANDRINVSGIATFGGTMRIKLPTGFVPKVGQQFIAINATQGRIGVFDSIEPPDPAPCNNVTFVLVYSSTAAIVLVRPPLGCTALGDLNSDGSINGKDIQLFVNNVLDPTYQSCADMNGDCADDAGDLTIFINAAI